MKKRIKYTDQPLEMEIVEDFLPPPRELARSATRVRVTLNLDKASVEFYKSRARQAGAEYHDIMRRLLDLYAARHVNGKRG